MMKFNKEQMNRQTKQNKNPKKKTIPILAAHGASG